MDKTQKEKIREKYPSHKELDMEKYLRIVEGGNFDSMFNYGYDFGVKETEELMRLPEESCDCSPSSNEDWEKEFDKKFKIIEIVGQDEAEGTFILQSDKEKVKDFIRHQRLEAQRELLENMIKDFETPVLNDKFIVQFDSIMVKFLKEKGQELGLLPKITE